MKDNTPENLIELKKLNDSIATDPYSISEGRQKFYYHTQRSTAGKILNGSEAESLGPHFRISSLDEMNDRQECEWHTADKERVYALCFSYTDSESIPMWYLYSGIAGEGIRIGITPKKMLGLIKDISCVYPIVNSEIDLVNPLYVNEDFSVEYGWVYYLGHKNIIYKNITYVRQDKDDEKAMESFRKDNYFVKDYEWNYEREFRIVFHLHDHVISPPKKIALFFNKEEMMKKNGGLSAMMAPEMKDISTEILAKELGLPEKKISKSNLNIKMNLIKRNRNSIVEYFEDIVEGIEKKDDLNRMRTILKQKEEKLPEAALSSR